MKDGIKAHEPIDFKDLPEGDCFYQESDREYYGKIKQPLSAATYCYNAFHLVSHVLCEFRPYDKVFPKNIKFILDE